MAFVVTCNFFRVAIPGAFLPVKELFVHIDEVELGNLDCTLGLAFFELSVIFCLDAGLLAGVVGVIAAESTTIDELL